MSLINSIGLGLQNSGKKLIERQLEQQYGKQIGKVANNGAKAYQKIENGKTITTGLTWDNKVISEVTQTGDKIKGSLKKIRKNRDGDIVEVTHSKLATDYRKNVSQNLETGKVKAKVLAYGVKENHPQHQVTTTTIDSSGNVNSTVKDVKIKGKNYSAEEK